MDRWIDHLVEQDLARRQGQHVVFARDLLSTLRRRELDVTAAILKRCRASLAAFRALAASM